MPLHTPHSECVSSSLPCDETAGSVDSLFSTTSGQCGHHGAAARDIGAVMDSLQLQCVEAADPDGEMSGADMDSLQLQWAALQQSLDVHLRQRRSLDVP